MSIYHALDEYSRAVERRDRNALPFAYEWFDGKVVACEPSSFVEHLTQAAGWPAHTTPPFYHELVVQSVRSQGEQWEVKAIAEIQVRAADGEGFLWRLPTLLKLSGEGFECRVRSITYDPTSRRIERMAAWNMVRFYTLNSLRSVLHSNRSSLPLAKVHRMVRTLLPSVITIAIDTSAVGACERRVLEWAVSQAINRWNRLLQGCHSLLWVDGIRYTDILIEAITQPIAGGTLAACYQQVGSSRGSLRTYATRADMLIRVLTVAALSPNLLQLEPESVRLLVEHELGHVFGLDDTNRRDSLMSGMEWAAELSAPGAAEERSIRRLHELSARYLALAHTRWRIPSSVMGAWSNAPDYVRREEIRRIYRTSPSLSPVAPQDRWVACIWEGEKRIRQGDWRQAMALFAEAAECAPDPSEAILRRHLAALFSPQPQQAMAALEAALRSGHRGWDATDRVNLHYSLADQYRRLGDLANAERHRACAEWLKAIRRVRWTCQSMVEYRSLLYLIHTIRDSSCAVRCGIRLLCSKVRRHLRSPRSRLV